MSNQLKDALNLAKKIQADVDAVGMGKPKSKRARPDIEIPLTKGRVVVVDADDYEWLSQHKWYALLGASGKWYACRNFKRKGEQRTIYMHREIMDAPRGTLVDHVDGDGLNNTRANLRLCSQPQNLRNRPKQKNNTSGFKGVSWDRRAGKWVAQIASRGRHIHVGSFGTAEDAARAYDEAALRFHGEFAYLNFPTNE